jgi:hypothetical protein
MAKQRVVWLDSKATAFLGEYVIAIWPWSGGWYWRVLRRLSVGGQPVARGEAKSLTAAKRAATIAARKLEGGR